MALISLAGFAHQTLSVTMITMATDLFPRDEVGTVAGLAGTCANLGILISSLLMGARSTRSATRLSLSCWRCWIFWPPSLPGPW